MTAGADPEKHGGGDPPPAPEAFFYHRALAPMLWAMTALGTVELFVVHLIVSIWSPVAALVLSVLTVASLAWLILLIRSLQRRPVLIESHQLTMRTGRLISVRVPLAAVASVRGHFPSEMVKGPGILKLAMLSFPNVLVELREPHRRGRRDYGRIVHCLDDPAAFVAALHRRLSDEVA